MSTKKLIFNKEKQFLDWVDSKLPLIVLGVLTVLGILVRLPLKDFLSGDFILCLNPWFQQIKESGLSEPVGNYNLPYQFIIFIMTKLPIQPLYSYKILSCIFDFGLAIGAALFIYHLVSKERLWKSIAVYGAVLISPIVFLNSSAWAQCDAIYACFAVFALFALVKEKYSLSMFLLGLSFAFKLQAVFILPIFLFVYFSKRSFSILHFLIVPATMFGVSLPMVFFGRSITEVITVYMQQTDEYPQMFMNYPSAWQLLVDGSNIQHYDYMKLPAMIITLCILVFIMVVWLKKGIRAEGQNILFMAFILTFTCVLFLPAMHERYGFVYEILAICIVATKPKTLPLCLSLTGITLYTYGYYLFHFSIPYFNTVLLSIANIAIYLIYSIKLTEDMSQAENNDEPLTIQ